MYYQLFEYVHDEKQSEDLEDKHSYSDFLEDREYDVQQLKFSETYPSQSIEKSSPKGKTKQNFKCQVKKPSNNCKHLKCDHKLYNDSSREIPSKDYSDKKKKSQKHKFNEKKRSNNRKFDRMSKIINDEMCDMFDDLYNYPEDYPENYEYNPTPYNSDPDDDSSNNGEQENLKFNSDCDGECGGTCDFCCYVDMYGY
jgi:hypothetical protein